VSRGPGLLIARFLPQHHERLVGIAEAAGVAPAALQLADSSDRIGLRGGVRPGGLDAVLPVSELRQRLLLRRSVPDVGGFASVELTSASWPGCLSGVNEEGIGVLCERDEDTAAPTGRLIAQELLLRVRSLDAAVDHARRRRRYVGGAWSLLVTDPTGESVRLESEAAAFRTSSPGPSELKPEEVIVRLDPASRRLSLRGVPDAGMPERVVDVVSARFESDRDGG
jgi:hypothetical protein